MYGDEKKSTLITQTAAFVALIAVGGWISIPFVPVPLTLQTLFVLLAGAVMKRYGVLPPLIYILLGALNMPVFHNGLAGIGILLSPTGGYILGFPLAALIAGLAYEHEGRGFRAGGLILATLAIYVTGISWLIISTGMNPVAAIFAGMLPFLLGDAIKAAAVMVIAERVR